MLADKTRGQHSGLVPEEKPAFGEMKTRYIFTHPELY